MNRRRTGTLSSPNPVLCKVEKLGCGNLKLYTTEYNRLDRVVVPPREDEVRGCGNPTPYTTKCNWFNRIVMPIKRLGDLCAVCKGACHNLKCKNDQVDDAVIDFFSLSS